MKESENNMETTHKGYPRVVVSGMGAITPLGTLDPFWEALKAGKSGIRGITRFDPADLEVKIAGELDFEPRAHLNPKAARRMSRASQLALVAAQMAVEDAGLAQEDMIQEEDLYLPSPRLVQAAHRLLVLGWT